MWIQKCKNCNDFGEEPVNQIEDESGMNKLKNGKAAGKDEITGESV